MRGVMPRARHSRRQRRWSKALSACSLPGRRRGRPRLPERTGGTASSVGASMRLSWRLAPLRVTPSGVPRASVTRCRFVPGLPRSVGFGPTSAPPFSPARWRCRARHAANRSAPRLATVPAAPGVAPPRPRRRASRAAGASRTCPTRSPSQPAASPTECPTSARTGCQPEPPGPGSADGRPSASGVEAEAAARSPPRDRQKPEDGPCPPQRTRSGFVRCSKPVASRRANSEFSPSVRKTHAQGRL